VFLSTRALQPHKLNGIATVSRSPKYWDRSHPRQRSTSKMAHSQARSSAWREGQLAVVGGALYGCTHTISGHPLDNVKTAMQLEPRYRGLSATATAAAMWRHGGLSAFARGCLPPMWGSTVYRLVKMRANASICLQMRLYAWPMRLYAYAPLCV